MRATVNVMGSRALRPNSWSLMYLVVNSVRGGFMELSGVSALAAECHRSFGAKRRRLRMTSVQGRYKAMARESFGVKFEG